MSTNATEAELRERIAKLREERAALAAEREERERLALMASELEAEERALVDDRAILAAVEEHGPIGSKIAVVYTDLGAIVVKRPNHLHFRRFQDSEAVKSADLEKLVRPCLVHPSGSRFDEILEELPATLLRVGDAVVTLAGAKAKESAGK